MRRVGVVGALTIAAIVAAGCSGGSDGDFSVAASLERLPDMNVSDGVTIQVGDLDAAADHLGLERVGDGEDLLRAVSMAPEEGEMSVYVPIPAALRNNVPSSVSEELGWGVGEVAQFAEATLMGGPLDFVLAAEPRDGAELGVGAAIDLGDGVFTLGEGQDRELNPEERTALRPLGSPLRLVERDDWTYLTNVTPLAGTVLNSERRLADDDLLAGIAEQLDEQGVYAASIVAHLDFSGLPTAVAIPPTDMDPDEWIALVEEIHGSMLTQPIRGVGLGYVAEDGRAPIVVVYAFGSEDSANTAGPELRTLWDEAEDLTGRPYAAYLTVIDQTQDGAYVTLTLEPVDRFPLARVESMLLNRELVFSHL